MAAGSGIEEISPGQVIPAEVAGRDRALRGSLAESAELYARAVLAEDWRVLGFGSLEAWQADVLGSARLAEPSISALHKGYSMIYSSHISWDSPTTPTPLELYPALAFDRLFRDEVGRGRRQRARPGAGRSPEPGQPRQPCRPPQARRIPVERARSRTADRRNRARKAGCKAGGRRWTSRTSTRPGRRRSAGHRPSTCG